MNEYMRSKDGEMSACGGLIRGGVGGEGNEGNGDRKKQVSEESPDQVRKEWGINVEYLDDMDRKLLKSLLNEGWRKEKRVLRKGEENISCDLEDKKRVRSPLNETKARSGKIGRVEEKPGRQTGRFDRSMRVLEWLDADCGTRLARHYEQAGGWRSLPERQQRHQRTQYFQQQQRQPLRLTGRIVLGTDVLQEHVKDSEEDSTTSEEEKIILEESDEFFNDEEADDDDLVLALRKWQEEQLLQQEHYEDLSMQDYVTSSEEENGDDSDSEDELVLALKAWQEEQQRQQKLQQRHHQQLHHRQLSLAQQPPALTPVIEDKVSSPSYDAFGYFYQDQNYLVYHYNKQRHLNHQQQQQSGAAPYWWGDVSSVREGPSSPPVLVKNSEPATYSNVLNASNCGNTTDVSGARNSNSRIVATGNTECDHNFRFAITTSCQGSTQSLPVATVSTLSAASAHRSFSTLHSPLLLPTSSISPLPSPRFEQQGRSFPNRVKTSLPSTPCEIASVDVKLGGGCGVTDNILLTKAVTGVSGSKISEDNNVKTTSELCSPHTPLANRTAVGGLGVFSHWIGSTSRDNHNVVFGGSVDRDDNIRDWGYYADVDSPHRTVSVSQSTLSSDSGIEKSPGYHSPAQKSAGIDKIGHFLKKFQSKLSTSSKTSLSSPSKQQPQQQISKKSGAGSSRRLSLSTPSIPCTSLTVPPSPLTKFANDHTRCAATRSDPLASGVVSKRQSSQWWGGQQTKSPVANEQCPAGIVKTSSGCAISNISVDTIYQCVAGDGGVAGGSVGGGHSACLTADSGPDAAAVVTQSDRRSALNIDTRCGSGLSESRKGGVTPTSGGPTGNSIVKVLVVGGKEAQPFVVPQSYQHLQQQQSQQQSQHPHHSHVAAKRSNSESSRKNFSQDCSDGLITDGISQSGSRYLLRDKHDKLNTFHESFDIKHSDKENVSVVRLTSGINYSGSNAHTRGIHNICIKSHVSEIEEKIHTDSFERDPQGKIRALFASRGRSGGGGNNSTSVVNCSAGSCSFDFSNIVVKSMTDSKIKETEAKEDSSICLERSSSTSSDEKGTLTVPNSGQDRGRRGSHGTCNYLFLEQASGRKSPLPSKGRTSPVRGVLSKGVVNSTSTSSSSSSVESSSKHQHQSVGRVLSLSSPSSPPCYLQQPNKTASKQLINTQQSGTESVTRKLILTDTPPANYRGRRKFSDTGLTPVPRRLFSDGRRGSLTDEKTLVFAKSKLEKLRNQDRKSSDASSVATLVKQIHNLWGDGDDEDNGDDNERIESVSGLTCSFDDQVFFEKRRKKLPLSVSQDKRGGKEGDSSGRDRKLVSEISHVSTVSSHNISSCAEGVVSGVSAEGKGRDNTADKLTLLPVVSQYSSSLSSSGYLNSTITDHVDYHQSRTKLLYEVVSELSAEELSTKDNNNAGALTGSCGTGLSSSEFLGPVAHVASRQLVAAAVGSVACIVGVDATENVINRGTSTISTSNTAGVTNHTNHNSKTNKKTATVQFQPLVSWDDNTVGENVSPALRSVLKQGTTRRHSSFAGFSESTDDLIALERNSPDNLSSVLNKQVKNGLPKSRTSDNYKSILKQTERTALTNIDATSSTTGDNKKRSKSPSPKSKKGDKSFDYSPDPKNSEISLSLCLKATRSLSPKSKKYRSDTKDYQESTDQSSQATPFSSTDREHFTDSGNCSLDLPTKTVGIQATPRTIGKTSNTGTQTSDLSGGGDSSTELSSSPTEAGGWLQRLAAKCMASVGGTSRSGAVGGGGVGGLPRAASVRAEWLLGSKRMGSNPSSPVAPGTDASERFWVPHDVLARKRAQSLVPSLSKQESEEDLSSEAATPASISHPRDLAFSFASEKAGTSGGSSDGQPSTPPSGYNLGRRRASMHDAIDLNKIDTRLYDKKLVRQASVTSIEEESQGTVHVSLEHNPETGILSVNLIRAHNLLPRDLTCTANPYCRITILPGQRTSAQSRIHRKTLNPEFEEEFIFELRSEEVATSTLEVSLYEYDQFSKDECVGYVRIPLNEMDLSKQVDLWRSVSPYEKPKDQRDLGDVMFSLSYLPSAERLTVVIIRARNLRLIDDGKMDLNPFIKVCITSGNKKLKKKKTSTAHSTNSPVWNEALVFSVHREQMKNIGLDLSAYHDNKLGIDECIGRIRLPANSDDGIHCQELLKEKNMPSRWYNLS